MASSKFRFEKVKGGKIYIYIYICIFAVGAGGEGCVCERERGKSSLNFILDIYPTLQPFSSFSKMFVLLRTIVNLKFL